MPRNLTMLLASSAAVALISGAGSAADLPIPSWPAPMAAPLAYDWSGIYVGLQGGGVWGDVDFTDITNTNAFEYDIDGWKIGGHAGGQIQWNWIVLGLEGDVEYADVNGALVVAGDTAASDYDWQASIRGRVGLAFDRLLIYGTGGAAYADIEGTIIDGGVASESFDISRWGWTAGGGVEFGITRNLSVGAEYRYTDLGAEQVTSAVAFPGDIFEWDSTEHAIRGRVSWRFGGPGMP
jgi:outer membrane immunogenic protein